MAGVQRHIGVQKSLHAVVVDSVDGYRSPPEETVVDEEHVGLLLYGGVDCGLAGIDRDRNPGDLPVGTAGDLHAIERDVVIVRNRKLCAQYVI